MIKKEIPMNDKELIIRELRKGIQEIKDAYRAALLANQLYPQWAYLSLREQGFEWEVK
jgi:hypothetical protein